LEQLLHGIGQFLGIGEAQRKYARISAMLEIDVSRALTICAIRRTSEDVAVRTNACRFRWR
jgi:hypothetical protein